MTAHGSGDRPRARRLGATGWALLTAGLALAGSVVTLLFTLVPDLKPDPHEKIGAAVEILAVERKVSVSEWLKRAFPGDLHAATERLFDKDGVPGYHGEVVYVRVQVDGFKHGHVTLTVRLHDARSQSEIELPSTPIDPERFSRVSSKTIDSPSRSSVQVLFLPNLTYETRHEFLRAELYEKDGVLAVDDSPTLVHGLIPRRG